MRVVSWNLARNTTSRSNAVHDRAWHFLAALDPDVALVQEAVPPSWIQSAWDIIKAPSHYWGSAILAKPALRLTALSPERETYWDRQGYLASGTVTLPDARALFVGSVHAPLMKALSAEYLAGYDPEAIKLPSYRTAAYYDVPYAIYKERVPEHFLVSGDWNISPVLWDQHHSNSHQSEFFDRARQDGWVDCYRQFHSDEGRTWFRRTDRPYQMDHAFCDPTVALALRSCEIEAYPAEKLRVSDHAALLLELEGW